MRYYLNTVKVSTTQEYLTSTKGYDTKDEAIIKYHEDMSAMMKNENTYFGQVIIWNSDGGLVLMETYGSLDDKPEEETTE